MDITITKLERRDAIDEYVVSIDSTKRHINARFLPEAAQVSFYRLTAEEIIQLGLELITKGAILKEKENEKND